MKRQILANEFALLPTGVLIKAQEANKDQAPFYCPGCRRQLVLRKGKIKVPHFSHTDDGTNTCNPETRLHLLSKYLLYQELQHRIKNKQSFYISPLAQGTCSECLPARRPFCIGERNVYLPIDVTKYGPEVYMEQHVDSFIPDVYLKFSENQFIFFEIRVTHESSEEKLNSSHRIIEIDVRRFGFSSLIKSLSLYRLPGADDLTEERKVWINYHNFKLTEQSEKRCNGGCNPEVSVFSIDPAGQARIENSKPLKNIIPVPERLKGNTYLGIILIKEDNGWNVTFDSDATGFFLAHIYLQGLVRAHRAGINFKSCLNCTMQKPSYKNPYKPHCFELKRIVNVSEAVWCSKYRKDNRKLNDWFDESTYPEVTIYGIIGPDLDIKYQL